MAVLIHGDCRDALRNMPEKSVTLTLTSPPYDNLRKYGPGQEWSPKVWEEVLKGLYRVTVPGGVVVWVVADATIKGSETGTSFKQALFAMSCGFNLHDTMIYQKANYPPLTHRRYEQSFEFMFVFSKGKPKTFNPIMAPCKNPGKVEKYGIDRRRNNGKLHAMRLYPGTEFKKTNSVKISPNIFKYPSGKGNMGHPAPFSERLANDQIISWSNKGDVVFDPFMGSGTTGKVAKQLDRDFIGVETVEKFFILATERIEKPAQSKLF